MTFLISSKHFKNDIDCFESSQTRQIGSFTIIEEKMESSIEEDNGLLIKGNIYGEDGLKTLEEVSNDDVLLEEADGSSTAVNIQRDKLELFRDYFGSKPVYFLQKNEEIFISDRIKPLLNFTETRPEKEICLDYLHSGLVDHERKTFFRNVKQLRPRESLFYSEKGLEINEVDIQEDKMDCDMESLVKENMQKKIPKEGFVCPVSGGLDSSIIASLVFIPDFELALIRSIKRIELLTTIPVNKIVPIIAGRDNDIPRSHKAPTTPINSKGIANIIINGELNDLNCPINRI